MIGDYTLIDWAIDVQDNRGECQGCHEKLEISSIEAKQCYHCGKWFDGALVGRSDCELMSLATLDTMRARSSYMPDYEVMRFIEGGCVG